LLASFFKTGLSENLLQGLDLGTLSPNPIRRDHKPFLKRLERKLLLNLKRHDGVINRRNGCSPTVAGKVYIETL
jgi:hypothetical protein